MSSAPPNMYRLEPSAAKPKPPLGDGQEPGWAAGGATSSVQESSRTSKRCRSLRQPGAREASERSGPLPSLLPAGTSRASGCRIVPLHMFCVCCVCVCSPLSLMASCDRRAKFHSGGEGGGGSAASLQISPHRPRCGARLGAAALIRRPALFRQAGGRSIALFSAAGGRSIAVAPSAETHQTPPSPQTRTPRPRRTPGPSRPAGSAERPTRRWPRPGTGSSTPTRRRRSGRGR